MVVVGLEFLRFRAEVLLKTSFSFCKALLANRYFSVLAKLFRGAGDLLGFFQNPFGKKKFTL